MSQAYVFEIHVIIRADVGGTLLIEKIEYLSNGFLVVGIHLGWTLINKIFLTPQGAESYHLIIFLLTSDINLLDMWNLDPL